MAILDRKMYEENRRAIYQPMVSIPVNAHGALTGLSADDHIRYIDSVGTRSKIFYKKVTQATADPNLVMSSLDCDTHGGMYEVLFRLKGSSASNAYIFANGDTTVTNYDCEYERADGGTSTLARYNTPMYSCGYGSDPHYSGHMTVCRDEGNWLKITSVCVTMTNTSGNVQRFYNTISSRATISNITSLQFNMATGNITVGSWFSVRSIYA